MLLGAVALLLLMVAIAKQRGGTGASSPRSDSILNVALLAAIALFFFTHRTAGSAVGSDRALWALQQYCRVQAMEDSDPLASAASLVAELFDAGSPTGSLPPTFAGRWRENPELSRQREIERWRTARKEQNERPEGLDSSDVCRAVEILARASTPG